ncbi:hypothetical protein, partial [Plesiomonas shigelloides]|uniref:hypothetical protein n=1 Tax=Plesiomonas shigelloides TaxID=703 RepID=UPI001E626CBE
QYLYRVEIGCVPITLITISIKSKFFNDFNELIKRKCQAHIFIVPFDKDQLYSNYLLTFSKMIHDDGTNSDRWLLQSFEMQSTFKLSVVD